MKNILVKYNKQIVKMISFKNKSVFTKIFMVFICIYIFIPVIVLSYSESILLGIAMLFAILIFLYVEFLIIYMLMVLPERYIFKESIQICDRIEKLFNTDFYEYDTYLTDNNLPDKNKLLHTNNFPDKKLRAFLKYKLSSKKETLQITLPLIGVLLIALFSIPRSINILDTLKNYIDVNYISVFREYFKWLSPVVSATYLFVIYYTNIERINICIAKIDFLNDMDI